MNNIFYLTRKSLVGIQHSSRTKHTLVKTFVLTLMIWKNVFCFKNVGIQTFWEDESRARWLHTCLNILPPAADSSFSSGTFKGSKSALQFSDKTSLIAPRPARRIIALLRMPVHPSGLWAELCTNLFPPGLITLRLYSSKPVVNNFWMWGISSTRGPSINTELCARCPRLLFVTWGGHISGTFTLKCQGKLWKTAEGSHIEGGSLRGLCSVWQPFITLAVFYFSSCFMTFLTKLQSTSSSPHWDKRWKDDHHKLRSCYLWPWIQSRKNPQIFISSELWCVFLLHKLQPV